MVSLLLLCGLLFFHSVQSSGVLCTEGNIGIHPLTSNASVLSSGQFELDWAQYVSPRHKAVCLDSITIWYGGDQNKECCSGYTKITKTLTKTNDTRPIKFNVCGEQDKVFLQFKKRTEVTPQWSMRLKSIPKCQLKMGPYQPKVCISDGDCSVVSMDSGITHLCFGYMCYPWKPESLGFIDKCKKPSDCQGVNEKCVRHPDPDQHGVKGLCINDFSNVKCHDHQDCKYGLKCVNKHCADPTFFTALTEAQWAI